MEKNDGKCATTYQNNKNIKKEHYHMFSNRGIAQDQANKKFMIKKPIHCFNVHIVSKTKIGTFKNESKKNLRKNINGAHPYNKY